MLCKYPWPTICRTIHRIFFLQLFFSRFLLLFFFFCKISHDSFAASPNTVKYTREISNVSSTYVKEVWHTVTEHLLGPVKVLHKQLSLRFTEQPELYKATHTSRPSCSYHIYSLMPMIRGLCMTELSFHHILCNKNRLRIIAVLF